MIHAPPMNQEEKLIGEITSEDCINAYKAMFLSGISQIHFALYNYKMDLYPEVISQMNEYYNQINSKNLKDEVSSLIDDANKKYINREKQNNDMSIDDLATFIIYGVDVSKNIYKGVSETKYRCNFSMDLNTAIIDKSIANTELNILNKIFDYHIFAKYAKEKYGDHKTYSAIQKECVNAYKIIESQKGKDILLKYISREFLKVRQKRP